MFNSKQRGASSVGTISDLEGMAVKRARADEYRRQAQECLELAHKISLERDRTVLLDMAQSCQRRAEEQETQEGITDPPAVELLQAAAQQQQQIQPKDDDNRE